MIPQHDDFSVVLLVYIKIAEDDGTLLHNLILLFVYLYVQFTTLHLYY